MFTPRLALASLSGRSDAQWAQAGSDHVGAALLGGIALDGRSRGAALALEDRNRDEFLPAHPIDFVDRQLERLTSVDIRAGINVRSTTVSPVRSVADRCRAHGALLEINAHCRQPELVAVGCGEALLRDHRRLGRFVATASAAGATVGVKVRAEVDGVDLPAACSAIEANGGSFVHVDVMDSPTVIEDIVASTDLFVIANNGVRAPDHVDRYRRLGADAVSIGRPSTDPVVRARVNQAVLEQYHRSAAVQGQ